MVGKVGPRVDTVAPLLHVEHVLKTGKLVGDIERQRTLLRENKELLKKINQIYRTKGFLNVDYSFRVHQSLNREARVHAARVIERENGVLLDRLLRRKPTVDSNLRRGLKPSPSFAAPASFRVDFWERTDRWLCQLAFTINPAVCATETLRPLQRGGKMFRIFQGMCLVLRSNKIPYDEEDVHDDCGNLQNVARGCLVRQRQGDREHLMITLRKVALIPGGCLLGRVVESGSSDKLDLLNYYGTRCGRCKEPINYDVTCK